MSESPHQRVTSRFRAWLRRRWRRRWKASLRRITGEAIGVTVLGVVLVTAWFRISPEMIERMLMQSQQAQFPPWLAEITAYNMKYLGFWLMSWGGIAIIFDSVRGESTLPTLWVSRPSTIVYCFFLSGLSVGGLIIAGIYRELFAAVQILGAGWWQGLVALSVFLFVITAAIDDLYRMIYSS